MRVLLLVIAVSMSLQSLATDIVECSDEVCLILPGQNSIDTSHTESPEISAVDSMIFIWDIIPNYLIAQERVQLVPAQFESTLSINNHLEKLKELRNLYQVRWAVSRRLREVTASATAATRDDLERP